jgi:hypothetical protein
MVRPAEIHRKIHVVWNCPMGRWPRFRRGLVFCEHFAFGGAVGCVADWCFRRCRPDRRQGVPGELEARGCLLCVSPISALLRPHEMGEVPGSIRRLHCCLRGGRAVAAGQDRVLDMARCRSMICHVARRTDCSSDQSDMAPFGSSPRRIMAAAIASGDDHPSRRIASSAARRVPCFDAKRRIASRSASDTQERRSRM